MTRASARARAAWIDELVTRLSGATGPLAGDYVLTRRNVFILPSRPGLLYAAALLAMLIASINYALSLGYALTFLLASLALVAMVHTFRGLSALTLRPGRGDPVFAGDIAEASVMVRNPSRLERYALFFDAADAAGRERVDVAAGAEQTVRLALPTTRRGWLQMPRLTISTTFPLGIWQAWSYWQPAQRVLVYPCPEPGAVPLPPSSMASGSGTGRGGAQEDVSALRPYVQGDAARRIAWKAVARSGGETLLVKEFEGGERGELTLAWDALPAQFDTEARLSRLARWVLTAEATGKPYALRIPGTALGPDLGQTHRARCLEALATYGQGGHGD